MSRSTDVRGVVRKTWEVMCACGEWDQCGHGLRASSVKAFERSGWRYDRKKGWMCPRCQRERADEIGKAGSK